MMYGRFRPGVGRIGYGFPFWSGFLTGALLTPNYRPYPYPYYYPYY